MYCKRRTKEEYNCGEMSVKRFNHAERRKNGKKRRTEEERKKKMQKRRRKGRERWKILVLQ